MGRVRFFVTGACAIALLGACGGLLGVDFGASPDDGAPAASADAAADGVTNGSGSNEGTDAAEDASIDAAVDGDTGASTTPDGATTTYPRIARFEMSSLTGEDGADTAAGMALDKAKPIAGAASATRSTLGFLQWQLTTPPQQLFLAFAFRLDQGVAAFVSLEFLNVTFGGGATPIHAVVDAGGNVQVGALGAAPVPLGTINTGSAYRLGLHVNPGNGNVQATLIDASDVFANGTFHSVVWGTTGAPQSVALESIAVSMTFDDVVISDTQLGK